MVNGSICVVDNTVGMVLGTIWIADGTLTVDGVLATIVGWLTVGRTEVVDKTTGLTSGTLWVNDDTV